jgi:serine/threonine-protein phosphatase 2A activator
LLNLLELLIQWVDEIPPIEQPMRFGNKAYRIWLDRVIAQAADKLGALTTQPGFSKAIPEIKVYFLESFGSYERLDYGTGHELNFVAFLFCMFRMGVYQKEDLKPAVNCVF